MVKPRNPDVIDCAMVFGFLAISCLAVLPDIVRTFSSLLPKMVETILGAFW